MSIALIFALILVAIPLGVFFLFSWLIIFHLKKYSLGNSGKKTATIFSILMIAVSLLIVQKFLFIDWDKVDAKEFIQESFNSLLPEYYDGR